MAAELDNDPIGFFPLYDIEDILQREGLEIELIRGVIIGTDRLRVAVHHNGLVAVFLEGKGGMDTAIVEFDPLPDSIRTPSEDHDLFPLRGLRLVLPLIAGVKVRGIGGELRPAGIHCREDHTEPGLNSEGAYLFFCAIQEDSQTTIGEAHLLDRTEKLRRQPLRLTSPFFDLLFSLNNPADVL